jgi:hypothetical protein
MGLIYVEDVCKLGFRHKRKGDKRQLETAIGSVIWNDHTRTIWTRVRRNERGRDTTRMNCSSRSKF